jgi:UDP-N-acetyl-D-glucosamine dehydrogenase
MTVRDNLKQKLTERSQTSAVIGLGYVGLPLAIQFAKAGCRVIGFDISSEKVVAVNRGLSYIADVESAACKDLVATGKLRATTDFSLLAGADTINICVPTPLRKTKDPDMSFVLAATRHVSKHLRPGMLVILESTTYPGTTLELLLPMLESSGLKCGADFFLCFSPERIDPGNQQFQTKNIPKVVGGVTPECTEMACLFYEQAIDRVVPVSSTNVAEMVKLLENTFRMINIGMVNELAIMCDRMSINVWEVIDAAATKPFGFMPFYPGPGLGGHCIPVDPFYLSWKSKQSGGEARFIELAGQINAEMPRYVVSKIQDALNTSGKALRGSSVHLLGVSYKKDIDDVRESPALDIIHILSQKGALVTYSDPHVPVLQHLGVFMQSREYRKSCHAADCVVIVTDHTAFDYGEVVQQASLIVDTRNALRQFQDSRIVRL